MMEVLYVVFTCILVLAIVSLYLRLSLGDKTQFDKVIRFFLVCAIIHVTHAFLVRLLPYEYRFIDRASPLGLIYGPLLYFTYLSTRGYELNKKMIFIHAIPFVIVLLFYSYFLLYYSVNFRTHSKLYYGLIYGPMAVSWFSYSLYVLYKGTVDRKPPKSNNRELPSIVIIILFMLSFFLILSVSNRIVNSSPIIATSSSLIIFSGMLGIVFSVFVFTIEDVKNKINLSNPQLKNTDGDLGIERVTSYEKSGLDSIEIEMYAKKINDYLDSKKFLNPNFNLNTLSSDLKIPRHYLSQTFSQYYGRSFLKHVNSLRIMHACRILEDPDFNSSIDELSEKCGFNSKTSFYRNFREITQMTPSEYQNEIGVK